MTLFNELGPVLTIILSILAGIVIFGYVVPTLGRILTGMAAAGTLTLSIKEGSVVLMFFLLDRDEDYVGFFSGYFLIMAGIFFIGLLFLWLTIKWPFRSTPWLESLFD